MLVTLLSGGASFLTIALTAFLMNSRQSFYALTFVDEFAKMGKRKLYMIHTMTDETYAVNCSLTEQGEMKRGLMFFVALFSRCYWMIGAVLGGVLGQLLPFDMEGIDFCMTALFVIIFIDQWEKAKSHFPALIGLAAGIVCLLIVGVDYFLLPFLIFHRERKMPEFLIKLGAVLQAAIMAVLIVYCLKDIAVDWKANALPKILAVLTVGISYKWKHNTLISIAAGTAIYMVLIRMI